MTRKGRPEWIDALHLEERGIIKWIPQELGKADTKDL